MNSIIEPHHFYKFHNFTTASYVKAIKVTSDVFDQRFTALKMEMGNVPVKRAAQLFKIHIVGEKKRIIKTLTPIINELHYKLDKLFIRDLNLLITNLITVIEEYVIIRDFENYYLAKLFNKQPNDEHISYRNLHARKLFHFKRSLQLINEHGLMGSVNRLLRYNVEEYKKIIDNSKHS